MPRGFHFELQTVLDQRQRVERARQGDLARTEQQRLAVEDRVRQIQSRLAAGRSALRDQLGGPADAGAPVDIARVRHTAASALAGLVDLQRAAIDLAGAHQRSGRARQALLRASVERKAVETLRERRRAAWLAEQKRREATELDDLVTMRHGREPDGGRTEHP